ncbi:MAG: histidine kinase [Parvularculaceae bacterium]
MNGKLPAWLISMVLCIAGWTFAAIVMIGAQLADAQARNIEMDLWRDLPGTLLFFAPLMALSWRLDRLFASHGNLTSKPGHIAALYLAVAFIFYPLYIIYEGAVGLYLSSQPLTGLWSRIGAQPRMGWWTDFMIVSGAFALHLAIAAWRNAVDRERALVAAHADNLQLRLTQLQGQLEPHFLFNALSGISALVRTGDRGEALTALSKVSDLLRYALRASKNDWLSVKDEINFLEGYLDIQALRFGDKLNVAKRFDDADWEAYACPPLLFQPLIENAVQHGLETRTEGAMIEIGLSLADGAIRFEVVNDVGERKGGHGVGLAATRQRLSVLYADAATLDTVEESGRYRATLCFPAASGQ